MRYLKFRAALRIWRLPGSAEQNIIRWNSFDDDLKDLIMKLARRAKLKAITKAAGCAE